MSIVKLILKQRAEFRSRFDLPGGGGLSLYQQFARISYEIADLERLYQKRHIFLFEIMLNFRLG
jgi:hypothetical protein